MTGLESILYGVIILLVFVVIALAVVYVMLMKKEKSKAKIVAEEITSDSQETPVSTQTKTAKSFDKKSIFDFMEFESVKDNMIVQKKGRKFLMAIECKGINYDLMSEIEKVSTEQGFSAFLNTLREPIQIYIQTRTINLEKNIQEYRDKVEKIKDDIRGKEYKLREYASRSNINQKILKDKQFELLREKNLYSYGVDIVADTQRMSLNKNVLKKKYYIIMSYFYEAADNGDFGVLSDEEIREIAFSNLYTRASSMIRVLSGIGVIGKALNSYELIELLYNAYNRDDSEVFGIDKAIEAGYDEIYVESQSIIDKKIAALNKEIEIRAQNEAKNAIDAVADERSKELKDIEENLDSIIADLAKKMIEDERNLIPENVKKKSIEKIEKNKGKKKGVDESNGKQETKESSGKRSRAS